MPQIHFLTLYSPTLIQILNLGLLILYSGVEVRQNTTRDVCRIGIITCGRKNVYFWGLSLDPKWTWSEREMNLNVGKKVSHVHELKIGENMSQIWATFVSELKWTPITFIFAHLCI